MSWSTFDRFSHRMSGLVAPIYQPPLQQGMEVDNFTVPATMDAKAALRSCTTCSKAKAKCVRKTGEQICERCVLESDGFGSACLLISG